MHFLIADTFTDSLARLTAQEQKAAKTTAFDLQIDPSSPGLSFHKLDRAKDPNFWSVRVNSDIRLIVHRTSGSLLLTYVDHHDKAYAWAERRRIERHPTTGAMQLVEIPERVEQDARWFSIGAPVGPSKPKLFDNLRKFELMSFGVPEEWVEAVRGADEDSLFDVISHLPQEAQEALLRLAVGERPDPAPHPPPNTDPFVHPEAQRRFRILRDVDDLQRALDAPWERWAVFLHPAQKGLVERSYSGPARVSGSAGTGKTVVALHRAVHLARAHPQAKVLLTTFSNNLAALLKGRVVTLASNAAAVLSRIIVKPITAAAYDLYSERHGPPNIAPPELLEALLAKAAAEIPGAKFSQSFLRSEWNDVIDAWQLRSWDAYRDVSRLGRKTRVGGKQREILWSIFEQVRTRLTEKGAVTWADIFGTLTDELLAGRERPFDYAVVDEAQDIGVAEARFLAALAADKPDGLLFTGDIGQRIFQQPFSWRALGLDVRGRSSTLRINYRTSHQIRVQADRLLPSIISDVDGNAESRRGTVSLFDGPTPMLRVFASPEEEAAAVGHWIAERLSSGCQPHEIGVFVRSQAELDRAKAAIGHAGMTAAEVDIDHAQSAGKVAVSTMHLAKGLEFRSVAVMACDDDIIPLQSRIEHVGDDADLEEVYETERHLLYVACTRARDDLLVTGVEPASEFLSDLMAGK